MSIVIDRRLNDRNKSAVNRARFLRRYKGQIRKSVADLVAKRSVTDMERGGDVKIPVKDISEPTFRHGPGGDREWVSPGNYKFRTGDRLPKEDSGSRQGEGDQQESASREAQDEFVFSLSREEFMNLFFDDLELPRMVRNALGDVHEYSWRRAGFTPSGIPANLAVARSLRNALARRIALGNPLKRELAELEDQATASPEMAPQLFERIERLRSRLRGVPWLDEFDLRYRHRVRVPQPISRAVMFCLMDVSASMNEFKKDLAKRFFTLLYLFLTRKYQAVELVFVRHTDDAEEVDEQTFFHDTRTGGTVVLSALKLMQQIIAQRFPLDRWNLYGAQVSDGDAFGADPEKSRALLEDQLLPQLRYFAYIELPDGSGDRNPLWHAYQRIEHESFAMKSVTDRGEIYPALRALFARESA